jgi:hypothetical protein
MKILLFLGATFLAAIIFGLALPSIIPGCSCGLDSGCKGCGELIGNALGGFSLLCFALGGMGFVLLIWFGIPIALLIFIWRFLHKLLSKKTP